MIAPRWNARLVTPGHNHALGFLAMAYEFARHGDDRYADALVDIAGYINTLRRHAAGIDLPPGEVPAETYWLVRDDGLVLGTVRLRRRLTTTLREHGGHISYAVRPSQRGRGYGEHLLRLTLARARRRGMVRVIVHCAADHVASARVIEKNGGRRETVSFVPEAGVNVARYAIDLAAPSVAL